MAQVLAKIDAEHSEGKALECMLLAIEFLEFVREKCTGPDGEKWSKLDTYASLRKPGDDDLTVIERAYLEAFEPDEWAYIRETSWIRRLRELISEGYDPGIPQLQQEAAMEAAATRSCGAATEPTAVR